MNLKTKGQTAKAAAVTCIYIAFLIVASLYISKRPAHNADMLWYMALAVSADHEDPNDIHRITFKEARLHLPEGSYRLLTDTTHHFRKKAGSNPDFFYEQLPYYTVKPLYVAMVYTGYKLGLNLVLATLIPSVLSFFAIGILIFIWLRRYLSLVLATLYSMLLCVSLPLINTAKLSTPDCLSAFTLLLLFYAIIEAKRWWVIILSILLAISVRIDNVLIGFILAVFITFGKKYPYQVSIKKFLLMTAAIGLLYLAVAYNATRYGWDILFVTSFFKKYANTYLQHNGPGTVKDLLLLRHSGIMIAMLVYHLFVYLAIALLIFIGNQSLRWKQLSPDQAFIAVLLFTILIRLALYTDHSDRHYIAYYITICILVAARMARLAAAVYKS